MNALSSMLNLGSPRPPVDTVPLGLETCWRAASAVVKSSIKPRRDVSAPVVNWSMIVLKTSDESRVHV